MGERVAYTEVEHDGTRFAVSTINRESSAALAQGMTYAETMVFALDAAGNKVRIAAQGEAITGSTREHQRLVSEFEKHGRDTRDDDETE